MIVLTSVVRRMKDQLDEAIELNIKLTKMSHELAFTNLKMEMTIEEFYGVLRHIDRTQVASEQPI
jgi:hypothetical protein